MYTIVVQVVQKSFCDLKMVEENVKVNKLPLASNNEQVV
jgi:hypothetical protein